jgi:hypothetical protein
MIVKFILNTSSSIILRKKISNFKKIPELPSTIPKYNYRCIGGYNAPKVNTVKVNTVLSKVPRYIKSE